MDMFEVHKPLQSRRVYVILRALFFIWVLFFSGGGVHGSESDLRDRIELKRTQIRDINVQIVRLENFLDGFETRLVAVEDAGDNLENLKEKLLEIEQKNLIKVMFQLGIETYQVIDDASGAAKKGVEKIASEGVVWAIGELGLDQLNGELKKAVGLDPSAYYAHRTVSLGNFSESALSQSVEVAKVQVILRKSLATIEAEYYVDNGEWLGQRGAIFYKNQLVREQIDKALEALEIVASEASATRTEAQNDLDWCLAERESLVAALGGFEADLAELLLTQQAEARATQIQELVDAQAPWDPAPLPPNLTPGQGESDYDFAVRKYNETVNLIIETFEPVAADVAAKQIEYDELRDQLGDALADVAGPTDPIARFCEPVLPDAQTYSSLQSISMEHAFLSGQLDKLSDAASVLDTLQHGLAELRDLAGELNDLRAKVGNLEGLAIGNPHPLTGPYLDGSYFSDYAEPREFPEIADWQVAVDTLMEDHPRALQNLETLIDLSEQIFDAIEDSYLATYTEHLVQVSALESASALIVGAIDDLEALCSASRFGVPNDAVAHELDTFFSYEALNAELATALTGSPGPAEAQAVWEDYEAFMTQYNALLDTHGYGWLSTRALYGDFDAHPPVGLADIRATVNGTGTLKPGLSLEQLSDLSNRFLEASGVIYAYWPEKLPVLDKEDLADIPLYPLIAIKSNIYAISTEWISESERDVVLGKRQELQDALTAWQDDPDHFLQRSPYRSVGEALNQQIDDMWIDWVDRHSAPRILSQSGGGFLSPGESRQLSVDADRNPDRYTWYMRDWLFGYWSEAGTGRTLTISYSDTPKEYYCEVANPYGTTPSMTMEIDPARPPEFSTQPASTQTNAGGGATLYAQVWGWGSLHQYQYQWHMSLNDDRDGPFVPVGGATMQQLNLQSVTRPAWFYLEVSNQFGSIESQKVRLSVNGNTDNPIIIVPASNLTLYAGYPFTFQLDCVNADGVIVESLQGDISWLTVDSTSGTLSGTPPQACFCSLQLRAYRDDPSGRVLSNPETLGLQIADNLANRPVLPEEYYFNPEELADPSVSGDTADPDKDGIPNLLEYFLGTSPRIGDEGPGTPLHFFHTAAGDSLGLARLSANRRTAFGFQIEFSDNLIEWHPLPSPDGGVHTDPAGNEYAIYLPPRGTGQHRCYRLRVFR
jgi:hypothetical protein